MSPAVGRRWFFGASLALVLAGCPVTDDYFLLPSETGPQAGSAGSTSGGAASEGGTQSTAGQFGVAGTASGGDHGGNVAEGGEANAGGEPSGGQPANGGASAGAGGEPDCAPAPEQCNGRDEDCDGQVDELVCATGCTGFTLTTGVGYMFCGNDQRRTTWNSAKQACTGAKMRLAWIESAEENALLTAELVTLTSDRSVFIGATDMMEGEWRWDGGAVFWRGNEDGSAVTNAFNAWRSGMPNSNGNEDCATIDPVSGGWNDEGCEDVYSYLCEAR